MWGEESRLKSLRERFKLLLETHRTELEPKMISLENGELLIKQGEKAEHCFLLVEGKVAIELKSNNESLHTLAVVEAEEFLGELALFGQGTHTCDVRVVDGSADLFKLRGEDLIKTMIFDSELVIELLALVSERCHKSNYLIALLLDGISAIHAKDEVFLEKTCKRLTPVNYSFAKAASNLKEIY